MFNRLYYRVIREKDMDRYKGILLCSDLDGTLRNSKGEISEKNLKAIEYFCQNGGLFTLCTGRAASYSKELVNKGLVLNTVLITLNGAMIYDIASDKVLYENPLDREKLLGIESFIQENSELIQDIVFHCKTSKRDYKEVGDEKLYKIVFVSKTPDESKKLRKRLEKKYADDFFITNSWPIGLEILAKKSTKGECIKNIKKFIPQEIKKVVCVGDYENDISMLKAADVSFAVKNAIPDVLKTATKITVSNDEDALAKIIFDEL